MTTSGGPSQREFDALYARVLELERYGSPEARALREAVKTESERRREEDEALEKRLNRMERAQTAFATGLGTVLTGVIVGVTVYVVTHVG